MWKQNYFKIVSTGYARGVQGVLPHEGGGCNQSFGTTVSDAIVLTSTYHNLVK